jgi:hypothetical protein
VFGAENGDIHGSFSLNSPLGSSAGARFRGRPGDFRLDPNPIPLRLLHPVRTLVGCSPRQTATQGPHCNSAVPAVRLRHVKRWGHRIGLASISVYQSVVAWIGCNASNALQCRPISWGAMMQRATTMLSGGAFVTAGINRINPAARSFQRSYTPSEVGLWALSKN